MNVKRILATTLIGAGILSFGIVGHTLARMSSDWTPYDDFSTKRLDPTKWFGEESTSGGPGGLESVRYIERRGQLTMRHRVSGNNTSSSRHISRNRLRMPREQRITGMQFDVKVKAIELRGCDAEGAADSAAKARGAMFLFNDGSSMGSGDATGDVGAIVEVYKSTSSTWNWRKYHVRGFVFRCRNQSCSSTSTVGSVDLGAVRRHQVATLGMQWHPETDEVSFWTNRNHRQWVAYDMNDDELSAFSNQRLEVRVEAANCEAGEPSFADMVASFDNVLIQP